jgi:hypothetical protein
MLVPPGEGPDAAACAEASDQIIEEGGLRK